MTSLVDEFSSIVRAKKVTARIYNPSTAHPCFFTGTHPHPNGLFLNHNPCGLSFAYSTYFLKIPIFVFYTSDLAIQRTYASLQVQASSTPHERA